MTTRSLNKKKKQHLPKTMRSRTWYTHFGQCSKAMAKAAKAIKDGKAPAKTVHLYIIPLHQIPAPKGARVMPKGARKGERVVCLSVGLVVSSNVGLAGNTGTLSACVQRTGATSTR